MDGKSRETSGTQPARFGLVTDLQNVKNNGSASLAELREFLGSLKGRNPQEVIGIVSTSLLVQSLIVAAVATVAILGVFTVGPYLVYGPPKSKQVAAKPAGPAATAAVSNAAASGSTTPSATASAGTPDAEKAAKVMGLDETRAADPKKNPLDKPDLDKLLDGQP